MILPVGDRPAPPAAAEGDMPLTGARLAAATRPRLRVHSPGACAETSRRNQRTLTLPASLDATTDETVRDTAARCLHDQPDVLMLDLRELNHCDDVGVRALRWVLRRAALVGATVCVIPPPERLRQALTLLGADDLLAVIYAAAN